MDLRVGRGTDGCAIFSADKKVRLVRRATMKTPPTPTPTTTTTSNKMLKNFVDFVEKHDFWLRLENHQTKVWLATLGD